MFQASRAAAFVRDRRRNASVGGSILTDRNASFALV